MAISFNLPTFDIIKDFSKPDNYKEWLPGLFSKNYYNNIFPINSIEDTITEDTQFLKANSSLDDFNLSLKRYFLFLYCLKSNPFIFEDTGKVIDYRLDDFLFRPSLADYVSKIQTNNIKNKINSSLTIELVKKYALDKGLDFYPEKLIDFFKIADSQEFKNDVSRKLNIVLYESVIKHTLYNNLKQSFNFSFKEDTSQNWVNKAVNLEAGDFLYFIDTEGGPDNKSFPVVCVLTKNLNNVSNETILNQSNIFLTNLFGRNVKNECLVNILGEPDKFENNFKKVPILKSKKNNNNFYNSICIVYDFTKILLSEKKQPEFKSHAITEIALGFLSEYTIELDNVDSLYQRKDYLDNLFKEKFKEDFSNISFTIANKPRHTVEIANRINILNGDEIKKSLDTKIKINKSNLINSFQNYIDLVVRSYKRKRFENIQLKQYSYEDQKIILHFDSALNLLAISCLPKPLSQETSKTFYSPFNFTSNQQNINFDFKIDQNKNFADEFYGSYSETPNGNFKDYKKQIKNLSGQRVCFITKTLERLIYDNFWSKGGGYYYFENLNSNSIYKPTIDLNTKITPVFKESAVIENYFNDDGRLIDKTIEIVTLNTNYKETKYQSLSLQTLAFYLINSVSISDKIFPDVSGDIKIFGERFHYPVLSSLPLEQEEILNLNFNLNDFTIPQEILIVPQEIKKAFSLLFDSYEQNFGTQLNSIIISSLPCYADIFLLLEELAFDVATSLPGQGISVLVKDLNKIYDRIPITDIILSLLEKVINQLLALGIETDPCKPLPKRQGFDVNDLLSSLEYLKDLYSNTLSSVKDIKGIVGEIPSLSTLNGWKTVFMIIFWVIVKIVVAILLKILLDKLRPYLEKLCNLDFNLISLFTDESTETLKFLPTVVPDSFGDIAESGGALYDVQLSIDINVLIDLSEIATREFVYNKFAEEFVLSRNAESLNEIRIFLTEISPKIDLYELASLLRGVATEYTYSTLIDAIKLSNISFKKLFIDKDGILKLFSFLSQYCDYNICYDLLSKSLQKYSGNICTSQQSRRKDYETILKELGEDPAKIIRDQVFDLEKQFDDLCSTNYELAIDILKDGPKLLANNLNQYLVMPLNTIIQFQKSVYNFELGISLDGYGTPLNAEQIKLLGDAIYNSNKVKTLFDNFKNNLQTQVTVEFPLLQDFSISKNPNTKGDIIPAQTLLSWLDFVKKDGISYYKKEIEQRKQYLQTINIIVDDEVIYKDLVTKKYFNVSAASYNLYKNFAGDVDSFSKFENLYKNIVYLLNIEANEIDDESFLDKTKEDMKKSFENANNLEITDTEEEFFSYINKLKEYK